MKDAKIEIIYLHKKAKDIERLLRIEENSSPFYKTRSEIKTKGDTLKITIESDDMPALRGSFNTFMNWLMAIEEGMKL
ncbi:MAG: CTAG/PCC1 family protein [Candidatus Methanofastidiosum sp.]|nr:CTAG/PCC1 family protein [Methanofastidiosum sp.]